MVYELIAELSCAATGEDCTAQEAWLQATLENSPQWARTRAVCLHWQLSSESVRDALAAALGISVPLPQGQPPVARAIFAEYEALRDLVYEMLAE